VVQCGAVGCIVVQWGVVCCSVLQCVAVCCSVLQCVAGYYSVLQCVAVCCSALQCIAVYCSVLQCVAVCRSVLQYVAVSLTNANSNIVQCDRFCQMYVVCCLLSVTGWRKLIGSPKLQIIFHKIATKYRSLLRKMTYKDK